MFLKSARNRRTRRPPRPRQMPIDRSDAPRRHCIDRSRDESPVRLASPVQGSWRLVIVRVPDQLSSVVELSREKFVWLDQVLLANLQQVFPDVTIEAAHLFRILRDSDIVLGAADASELPS